MKDRSVLSKFLRKENLIGVWGCGGCNSWVDIRCCILSVKCKNVTKCKNFSVLLCLHVNA